MTGAVYTANLDKLSRREKEVLDLVSELPPDERDCCGWIAKKLFISKRSLEGHMRNITKKMGVASIIALVALKYRIERERVSTIRTYLWCGNDPIKLFDDGVLDRPKKGAPA